MSVRQRKRGDRSAEYARAAARRRERARQPSSCEGCGAPLRPEVGATGRPRRYCDPMCGLRRRRLVRGRNRTAEYARAAAKRAAAARRQERQPLAPLFPHLHHGARLAFRDEELAMELEQERALAVLEGRDPEEAVRAYRAREITWLKITGPAVVGA